MIRQFTPSENIDDFNALLNPYLKIINHSNVLPWVSSTLLPFDETTVTEWFQSSTGKQISYYAKVDEEDTIQGIIILKPNRVSGFEILACFVHPKVQGQGIGRSLLRHAEKIAMQQRFRAIAADVFCANKRMFKLMIDEDYLPIQIKHHQRADGGDVCRLLKTQLR